jgi:hypothetical protein
LKSILTIEILSLRERLKFKMSKHRIVKSDFWVDEYVEELPIHERYFFLYLLTNPGTNILGIYKTTLKRICFETGLGLDEVKRILDLFSSVDKVHFIDNHILMVNFQKHQHPSGTMKKGIVKLLESLPKLVIDFILSKESKIYDRLYIGYLIDYRYPYKEKDNNKGKDKKGDEMKSDYPEEFLKLWNDYPNTNGSKAQTLSNYQKSKKVLELSDDQIYKAAMISAKKQKLESKGGEVYFYQLSNVLGEKYRNDLPDLLNYVIPEGNGSTKRPRIVDPNENKFRYPANYDPNGPSINEKFDDYDFDTQN